MVKEVADKVKDLVREEIIEYMDELPLDLRINHELFAVDIIDVSGSSALVENYLRYDDYYDDYESYRERRADSQEVDYIFER